MRYFFVLFAAALYAQQPVAPTPEQAGAPRGENHAGYNLVNSFEAGYRMSSTGGNSDEYRSSVNYGNGIRLLSSFFSMNSREGHGRWFDELTITTQGLGNDPYESATFRLRKNKLYRYDGSWRLNDYFNPGLTSDGGAGTHRLDTRFTMQDHDVTLFPEGNFKFFAGYSQTAQTGPALTTELLLGSTTQATALFADVRRMQREFRVGNEINLFGMRLNWMHGWNNFKEDTATTGSGYRESAPYHGNAPYWRVALFTERRIVNVNGRFTYTAGRRLFVVDELASGLTRRGDTLNRQFVTYGNGSRPAATGTVNIAVRPGEKWTIVNSTAVHNIRTSGGSYYIEFDNGSKNFDVTQFNYLGIRTVANDTEASYQATPAIGAFAGYQFSDRQISSSETYYGSYRQSNRLQAGRAGVRLRPVTGLSVMVSGEVGTNDQPFTPIADRDFHAINARAMYRNRRLQLTAGAETLHNANSVAMSAFSSEGRKYYASGAWTVRDWVSLDAAFTRAHTDTAAGINYFSSFNLTSGRSLYESNLNTAIAGARFAVKGRVDLYAAFTHVSDSGKTFPVRFDSPLARASVRITPKLRWNAGYQYYGYRQDLYRNLGFRAHTGYTSLSFAF